MTNNRFVKVCMEVDLLVRIGVVGVGSANINAEMEED